MKPINFRPLLLIMLLLASTPALAQGQDGAAPLVILIAIVEVIVEAVIIGVLLKFILGFLKVNITYKTAILISLAFAALTKLL